MFQANKQKPPSGKIFRKKLRSHSLFSGMSSAAPGTTSPTSLSSTSSNNSKFASFFRRRRKSTNHSTEEDVDALSSSEVEKGKVDNLEGINDNVSGVDGAVKSKAFQKEEYGNYNTVSGTGANLLKDVFNKKYRGSMKPNSLASKLRFRKDPIKEERSISPLDDQAKSLTPGNRSKLQDDVRRSRHTSISYDHATKKYLTTPSSKLGGLMPSFKGLFDSFRQRSVRDSTPDPSLFMSSSTQPTSNPDILNTTIVYAPGKKKTRFKVSRTLEDEPNKFGPNSYLEMYRRNQADTQNKKNALNRPQTKNDQFSKASTIHACEPMQIVIWKDKKRGTRVFKLPKSYTDSLEFEKHHGEIVDSEELEITRFCNSHSCYDLMPPSSKLIIFDIDLNVKKAFFALLQNGIRSAPIWSYEKHDYVGLLTVTDFLKVIQKYFHSSELNMKDLEEQRITIWKELLKDSNKSLIRVEPDTSLLAAIAILTRHRVSHLPVVEVDTGNILYILTAKRIIKFLASYMNTMIKETEKEEQGNQFLQQTIQESGLAEGNPLHYVTLETSLIQVIDLFLEKGVSAFPVVTGVEKEVVDVYTKADVLSITNDQMINSLGMPLNMVLRARQNKATSKHLQMCSINERVCGVIDKIVDAGVHLVVIVSDRKELKRVISVSDILDFLVLKPFYKYRDLLEEKKREMKRLSESLLANDSYQQQRSVDRIIGGTLPTLQEHTSYPSNTQQQQPTPLRKEQELKQKLQLQQLQHLHQQNVSKTQSQPQKQSKQSQLQQSQPQQSQPQQSPLQPQQSPLQPQQSPLQPQKSPLQPQQSQHQQSPLQPQQSPLQPQQSQHQQSPLQPQQSPLQPQQSSLQPQLSPSQQPNVDCKKARFKRETVRESTQALAHPHVKSTKAENDPVSGPGKQSQVGIDVSHNSGNVVNKDHLISTSVDACVVTTATNVATDTNIVFTIGATATTSVAASTTSVAATTYNVSSLATTTTTNTSFMATITTASVSIMATTNSSVSIMVTATATTNTTNTTPNNDTITSVVNSEKSAFENTTSATITTATTATNNTTNNTTDSTNNNTNSDTASTNTTNATGFNNTTNDNQVNHNKQNNKNNNQDNNNNNVIREIKDIKEDKDEDNNNNNNRSTNIGALS